jgi:hypothetical protein
VDRRSFIVLTSASALGFALDDVPEPAAADRSASAARQFAFEAQNALDPPFAFHERYLWSA